MRKKSVALIAIHLIAVTLIAYGYSVSVTSITPELMPTTTASPAPLPTAAPASYSTEPHIVVYPIRWDPHNLSIPTMISILSPQQNQNYTSGYVYLSVGVSSSDWIINGVFYTTDWIDGPQPIWFYNLSTCETALYASISFMGVPDGNHRLTIHMNVHDGTYLSQTVTFTVNSRVST
jgi:hypothetical protein